VHETLAIFMAEMGIPILHYLCFPFQTTNCARVCSPKVFPYLIFSPFQNWQHGEWILKWRCWFHRRCSPELRDRKFNAILKTLEPLRALAKCITLSFTFAGIISYLNFRRKIHGHSWRNIHIFIYIYLYIFPENFLGLTALQLRQLTLLCSS